MSAMEHLNCILGPFSKTRFCWRYNALLSNPARVTFLWGWGEQGGPLWFAFFPCVSWF